LFSGRQRDDAVGIRIVPDRGGKTDVETGARQIDRSVESVAPAGRRESAVAARVNSIKTSPTQMTRDFRSIISGPYQHRHKAWQ